MVKWSELVLLPNAWATCALTTECSRTPQKTASDSQASKALLESFIYEYAMGEWIIGSTCVFITHTLTFGLLILSGLQSSLFASEA